MAEKDIIQVRKEVAEFHRANAAGNAALFARAHNAGLVLGYFDCFPGYGLQPGAWKEGSEYPPGFLTICGEACVSPKRIVRDIKAYDHYLFLRGWAIDSPAWLMSPHLHPRALRRRGITLGHFAEMRELGAPGRYALEPFQQLHDLNDAAEAGWGSTAMRAVIKEREESNGAEAHPDPLPKVWARRIAPNLERLATTDFDNDPEIRRAAGGFLTLLKRKGWA